jgi:glycosyltransferase involved in cell wall biosynthesis
MPVDINISFKAGGKMKVVVLSFSSKWAMGSGAVQVANNMAEICDEVLFVAGPLIEKQYLNSKVTVEIVNVSKSNPVSFLNFSMLNGVIRKINKFNPDVIYIYSAHPWNIFLADKVKAPIIYTFHDPIIREKINFLSKSYIYQEIYEWEYRKMAKKAKSVLITANSMKKALLGDWKVPNNRISVIALPSLLMNDYYEEFKNEEVTSDFVFFGRAEKYKGLDVLIDAILLFRKKNPEIKGNLIVQGNIEDLVEPGKLEAIKNNIVIINDYLSEKELGKYIAKTKMVVAPYLSATGSHVPHNTFCYGKPLVTTKVGCFPEYVHDENYGVLVDPGDVKKLADAMEKTLNTSHNSKLIRQRFEYFHYNWLEETLDLLKRCMEK